MAAAVFPLLGLRMVGEARPTPEAYRREAEELRRIDRYSEAWRWEDTARRIEWSLQQEAQRTFHKARGAA